MYINCIFELSKVLDNGKFRKVLAGTSGRNDYLQKNEDEYIDQSFAQKGLTVVYRDSQYKKKVRILADLSIGLKNETDVKHLTRKLDKQIAEYFGYQYRMDDFTLSGMLLTTDIDVGTPKNVYVYLKVLQRSGKVKGFSPSSYDCFEAEKSFCLDGNSNGIQFLIYDLGSLLERQLKEAGIRRKKLKLIGDEVQGILRAEVRLTKPKAVRAYTDAADVSGQIAELLQDRYDIFMDTFTHIVPIGDFYKKDNATEIIWKEVKDTVLRRKMLRLLTLIPEKKSLYLAQKAMNCRDIERVMDMFAKINVSPITISKRQGIKHLKSLYYHMSNKT